MAFVGAGWARRDHAAWSARSRVAARATGGRTARRGAARQLVLVAAVQDVEMSHRALRNLSFVRGQLDLQRERGFAAVDAALTRKNDTARSYISDEQIDNATGAKGGEMHRQIRDNAQEIVAHTMEKLKGKHADVMAKPTAAKCVQVDVEWFLRVTSYGVACECASFLNMESLALYPDIYESMGLGVPFLVELVEELKAATVAKAKAPVEPYFDSFRAALETLM
ncbi:Allophycocyanin alpha-B chain [Porphyridium purpureum]|uniref:Allophycocyanin alpha-B chain n=1 Tax=Porphyridium purpureum TaxID=35688 RepID=A0A5J4YMS0_PORPP|nr:Allophycocyanin alpha-B chain [Porphyridium purpureum]|eukprot:POR5071..scf295_9